MKISLSKPTSGYNLAAINENFVKIEQELQNKVLYRDNPVGEPNTVENDIDMNGNSIYNISSIDVQDNISIGGIDLGEQVALAQAAAVAAEASANEAEGFRDEAEGFEQQAELFKNDAAASFALTDAIADAFAGGTIGFTAAAYDWGSVADASTYFNRDFGLIV